MRLLKIGIIFFTAFLAVSCAVEDCADCRRIVKDDKTGKIVKDEDTPITYCGDKLDEIESQEPVPAPEGGETSYYLCQ